MPRDANGTYTLPAGNPVVSGTVIETNWANPTMSDVGSEMSDSMSRSGKGGMLTQFKSISGTMGAPGVSFLDQLTMGLYRASASDMRVSINGVDRMRFVAGTPQIWEVAAAAWSDIAYSIGKPNFVGDNPSILNTTAAAMITGDADPLTGPHIEYGFNSIQSKGDDTSVDNLFLQRLGGDQFIGAVGVTGIATTVSFFSNGLNMLTVAANSATLNKNDSLAATTLLTVFKNADGSYLGAVGVNGTDNFNVESRKTSANINLICTSSGGAPVNCGIFNANVKGDTGVGGLEAPALRSTSLDTVPGTGTGSHFFQSGQTAGKNLAVGINVMQGRNNGAAEDIEMQPEGGTVTVGGEAVTFVQVPAISAATAVTLGAPERYGNIEFSDPGNITITMADSSLTSWGAGDVGTFWKPATGVLLFADTGSQNLFYRGPANPYQATITYLGSNRWRVTGVAA
tara:strand:+ start:16129 stop:17493 length:1365 start_codon:yes stop_codon:yes gene_type:complete